MSEKNNVDDPILVIIKRGRGGRGYIVRPADSDIPFPCMSAEDIGLACIEMLNDENQPRIDGDTVAKEEAHTQEASEPGAASAEQEDDAPQQDAPEENPYAGKSEAFDNLSPTDKAVVSGLNWIFQKTKSASNHKRRGNR